VPAVAGGICQVSTALFQSVFWAGYQIDERHWHTFAVEDYADRGYLGLDATVSPEDGIDFRFTNNSSHALLILADAKGGTSHVTLVGTRPDWSVQVDPEVITDVVPAPEEIVRFTSPLFARGRQILQTRAHPGLTSRVVRHVVFAGGLERSLRVESNYRPAPTSILVGTG
jgi:vancomycin resistance protein YoaR